MLLKLTLSFIYPKDMADDFASLGQLGGPRKKQKVLDASAAALVDLRVELSKKQNQFEKEIK